MAMQPMEQFQVTPVMGMDHPLFHLFGKPIYFTNQSLLMVIVVLAASLFLSLAVKPGRLVPNKTQSMAEISYEFVAKMIHSAIVAPNSDRTRRASRSSASSASRCSAAQRCDRAHRRSRRSCDEGRRYHQREPNAANATRGAQWRGWRSRQERERAGARSRTDVLTQPWRIPGALKHLPQIGIRGFLTCYPGVSSLRSIWARSNVSTTGAASFLIGRLYCRKRSHC